MTLTKACLGLGLVALLASCGGDSTETAEESPETTAAPVESEPQSAATTTAAPTTTVAPTTTTKAVTGTFQSCEEGQVLLDHDGDGWGGCTIPTTIAPTTTVDVVAEADFQVFFALNYFNENKADLAEAMLDDLYQLESVDLIDVVYGPDGTWIADLNFAVTSGYSTQEILDEIAWTFYKSFASFWEAGPDPLLNVPNARIRPGLDLRLDDSHYYANFDLMVLVAEFGVSSADFIAQARVP